MGANRVRDLLVLVGLVAMVGRFWAPAPEPVPVPSPRVTPTSATPSLARRAEPQWVVPIASPTPAPTPEPRIVRVGVPTRTPRIVSVNGIERGMTIHQVEAWLGPNHRDGHQEMRYSQPPVLIRFHGDRVWGVWGTKLRFDGLVVLMTGDSRQAAIRALGEVIPWPEHLVDTDSDVTVRLRGGCVERILLASRC